MSNTSKKKARARSWIPSLLVLGIIMISIAGLAGITYAGLSLSDKVAKLISDRWYDENVIPENNNEYSIGASADYCDGTEETQNACVWDIYDLTVGADGLTVGGPFTANATTTPAVNTYYSISESLDLTGTSTVKGATQNVISYYTNTGSDLWVDWIGLDFSTALGAFEASVQCATSTWIGGVEGVSLTATTSASVIASTTVASTYTAGSDPFIIDIENNTATSGGLAEDETKFLIKNGEVLFCTWTPYGATSSASFLSSGGFTGVGRMLAETHARGN